MKCNFEPVNWTTVQRIRALAKEGYDVDQIRHILRLIIAHTYVQKIIDGTCWPGDDNE